MDRILLALILGLGIGVLSFSYIPRGWSMILFVLVVAAVLFLLHIRHKNYLFLVSAACFVGVVCGMGRTMLVPIDVPETFHSFIGTSVVFEGVVVADPDIRETTQRLTVLVEKDDSSARILVVAPLYPVVSYGDTIRVEGELARPESFDTDGGRVFRYDQFLEKDEIFLIMQRALVEAISPREGVWREVRGFFADIKREGVDALGAALPEPHASLASGIILGGKQGLGADLLDDFIRSGLVHIVVLSGYNVMIVAEFVLRLFGTVTKRYAVIAAGITIFGFVLAAGAGPASIRAGIMAGIALFARATGRTYDALRALILAGVVMVLWNPLILAFDPGFQLSFVATLGLIFGTPIVEKYLVRIRSAFLKEIISATIAAQIAVLPLLLYQNGLLSLVSLPANIIVLPFVPLAMLLSAIALGAGLLLPSIAPLIGLPAYALLSYIIGMVEMAASLPLAAISIPAFPFWIVIILYILLSYAVLRFSHKR